MLGKRIASFKNLAKKMKSIKTTTKSGEGRSESTHNESLLNEADDDTSPLTPTASGSSTPSGAKTPTGTFAVYVGKDRVRRVVPTSYLNHPLFRMLLDKSHDEFHCFEQKVMLVIPCSLSVFQDVVNAIESCDGKFEFGDFVEEFL